MSAKSSESISGRSQLPWRNRSTAGEIKPPAPQGQKFSSIFNYSTSKNSNRSSGDKASASKSQNFNSIFDHSSTKNKTFPSEVHRSALADPDSSTLLDLVCQHPISSWKHVFKEAWPELEMISEKIQDEQTKYRICPDLEDIFTAFECTPFKSIKVVLLGQDPYPQVLPDGRSRATGLSFSVRQDDEIPSSLLNIYKELQQSIPGFKPPSHGCLEKWTRQGVFLLNMGLTVRAGQPGSHVYLWSGFLYKVIRKIVESNPNVIFLLWGAEAQAMKRDIGDSVTKFTARHPSGKNAGQGFIGCQHFAKVNRLLKKRGLTPIDWTL
jgi:uracil-DNA glycosylase